MNKSEVMLPLTEKEERLISAYLDNELSASEQRAVEDLLQSDVRFQRELRSLKAMRDEVRTWAAELKTESLDIDIWDNIRERLTEPLSKGPISKGPKSKRRRSPLFGGAAEFFERVRISARLDLLAGASAAVAAVVLVVAARTDSLRPSESPSPAVVTARPAEERLTRPLPERAESQRAGEPAESIMLASESSRVRSTPENLQAGSAHEFVQALQSLPSDQRRELPEVLKLRLLPPNFVAQNLQSNTRGLRTDGVDIDWIRSEKPFRFVPSTGRSEPPVIWVANRGKQ